MRTLRNYVQDQWIEGTAPFATLHNAFTEESCAQASVNGVDVSAAMAHARKVGGSSLRNMSFAERGAMLKRMSEVIHGARDELIALAQENSGNTRGDAKFDIDGASGTLAYYASLGRKMGDNNWKLDGEQLRITRSARFVGQHIWVARRGVAVHINAFNFPAWNMCEKLACALLAGMPVYTKPATATAIVSERIVALWVEANVVPAGVVSLHCGSAGSMLDHVRSQDCVVFTGSGDTGRLIRAHEAVIAHNVPVNIEADSLNVAVLAPDVKPDSDTFWMFISDVARDMTQKAGQKCTAIRRIIIPESATEAVVEALADRLDQQILGSPYERPTTVGPLATASQKRDIQAGIAALSEHAKQVWGQNVQVPDTGYFVAPGLYLVQGGVDAPFVHEHEVFGPIATIVPCSGTAEDVIDIVAAGGGGLVASMYTNDRTWGREVILGIAPWNGRIHWGSKKVHDQSSGPGTVLPTLVHGGPGKAGGGEELGGERGLNFYWQRTALQGDRALFDKLFPSEKVE
jgi:oxepin-CoA hydrolase/3-oxo-5,6-dehydrosuberyl-CoA semialdehyde dehydrogenase